MPYHPGPRRGPKDLPSNQALPRNRALQSNIHTRAKTQIQSQESEFQTGSGSNPSRQHQFGQGVTGIRQRRTEYFPATTRPVYTQFDRQSTSVFDGNGARSAFTPNFATNGDEQPSTRPYHGHRASTSSEQTMETLSDTHSYFEESFNSMDYLGTGQDSFRQPLPYYNSTASERDLRLTPPGAVTQEVQARLRNDDSPWSVNNRRRDQDPMGLTIQQFREMQQANTFQADCTGEVTSSSATTMVGPSHISEFYQDVHKTIQGTQWDGFRNGYGQVNGEFTESNHHPRAPQRLRDRQHAPDGASTQNIGANIMTQSVDSRSRPSSRRSSTPPDPIKCPECEAEFTKKYRKGNFGRHWREWHTVGRKFYDCEVEDCDRSYKRKDARLKHHRKKHPDVPVPGSTSSRSGQGGMNGPVGLQHDEYSNPSQNFNDFNPFPTFPTNTEQPHQSGEDLLGLMDKSLY